MELPKLLEFPRDLLSLWHSYRLEFLVYIGVGIALFPLAIYLKAFIFSTNNLKTERKPDGALKLKEKAFPTLETLAVSAPDPERALSNLAEKPKKASPPREPRRVKGTKTAKPLKSSPTIEKIQPHVFYFTLGGSTRVLAENVAASLASTGNNGRIIKSELHDLTEIDYDDFFIAHPKGPTPSTAVFYIILLPSYNIDTELSNFLSHLEETHHDFRIDTAPLSSLAGYTVFGLGDRQEWPTEHEGFCSQAVEVDRWMAKLTNRRRAFPLGTGDVKGDAAQQLHEWQEGVCSIMADLSCGKGLGEGVPGSGDAVESEDESADSESEEIPSKRAQAGDLEDMKAPIPVDFTTVGTKSNTRFQAPKPMVPVTSPTYTSLTKQGYTIVGTHSGVKICRWTKSALRGRGSCYKYSFYGIASHRCMEATPSLSCSNKCVFCWRHGTNPVGTTWRWEVDPPELIFDGIKQGHYKKIKMLRGVPGVRSERFSEAMTIRHCALSLVGEPIFYPHINKLLAMLHADHISSFLVCNAQHPDQLATLGPVTQLYVSIDASNKESLRRIDRPLHRDFWERFTRCMDILREKRFTHRTVFRLTLVKGFNIEEEATGYVDLVERALPGLVEIKGVTYCGTSTATGAGLSMQNVPFYEEVTAFVLALQRALQARGLDYGVAAEHAHSCCVLLADRKRFFRPSQADGVLRWHTLIDYPKFFACVESGKPFAPEDYVGEPTPEWALWGNGGFDPRDERVDRKGRPKVVEASR